MSSNIAIRSENPLVVAVKIVHVVIIVVSSNVRKMCVMNAQTYPYRRTHDQPFALLVAVYFERKNIHSVVWYERKTTTFAGMATATMFKWH